MVDVYFYIPKEEVNEVVSTGIDIAKYGTKEVEFLEKKQTVLVALLNPKDDIKKYSDDSYECLKISVNPSEVLVGDCTFYYEETMDKYFKSLELLENYVFGTKRNPECLILTSITTGISKLNKGFDSPIIYENSEKLYIDSIFGECREKEDNFDDKALFLYLLYMCQEEKATACQIEDNIVFTVNETGKTYITKEY